MDTRETVKRALVAELTAAGTDGTVVAVVGAWGSGKTFLWREVADVLRRSSIPTAYASLFGLTSIAEVKAAIVNDTVLGGAVQESKLKQLIGWGSRQLPGVLKMLDDKIGFELLTRNLDLTRLIKQGTAICLDDLERIADSVNVEDVLGLAGFLAEQRGARVVLIFNDVHLERRRQDHGALVRAYRERVVRLSLRLEPTLRTIAPSLQVVANSPVAKRHLDGVLELAERAALKNVRTMMRVLERIRLLGEAYGIELPSGMRDFLFATVVEEADGNLRPYQFYEFNPILFAFEKHLPKSHDDEPSEEEVLQRQFFARYFSPSTEYVPSRAVHEFVSNGYPDPEALILEIRERTAQSVRTPVQHVLEPWRENGHWNYSDAELRSWIASIGDVLAGPQGVSPRQCVECVAAAAHASEMLGEPTPGGLLAAATERLRAAAESGDASLERDIRHGLGPRIPASMVSTYSEALAQARVRLSVAAFQAAVQAQDLERFQGLLDQHSGLTDNSLGGILEALDAIRDESRDFYFNGIFAVTEACANSSALGSTLRIYLSRRAADESREASDRWRLTNLLGRIPG
jgi:hypothetical protein